MRCKCGVVGEVLSNQCDSMRFNIKHLRSFSILTIILRTQQCLICGVNEKEVPCSSTKVKCKRTVHIPHDGDAILHGPVVKIEKDRNLKMLLVLLAYKKSGSL